MSDTVAGNLRLPNPPEEYEQGYMNRIVNTMELNQRITFLAASTALENVAAESEAVSWFFGK